MIPRDICLSEKSGRASKLRILDIEVFSRSAASLGGIYGSEAIYNPLGDCTLGDLP